MSGLVARHAALSGFEATRGDEACNVPPPQTLYTRKRFCETPGSKPPRRHSRFIVFMFVSTQPEDAEAQSPNSPAASEAVPLGAPLKEVSKALHKCFD